MTLMGTSASSGTVRNYLPAHARRLANVGPIFDGFLLTSTNGNEPLRSWTPTSRCRRRPR
jgi:hypothetical protein